MIKKLLLFVLLSIGHIGLSYADFQDGLNALDKEDYKTAFNEFLPLAEQGDVDAQNKIGALYANGLGVIEDDKEAVKWYTKAAEQGYASAQTNLADYLINEDYFINWVDADMWYSKAAEQGYLRAQYNFAIMHQQSHLLQDITVAVKWFTKAAEQGDLDAQINLGVMYYEGRDWLDMDYQAVSQDYIEAFKWFSIPAEQDYPIAQYALGEMYANGFGVLKDMAKAKYWIKKAYENTDEKVSNAAKDIWERLELSNY
jgi:TPR repeat protein